MSDHQKRPWGARLANHFRKLAPGREQLAADQWHSGGRDETAYGALEGSARLPGLVAEDRLALFGDDALNDARRYVLRLGLRRLLDSDAVERLSPLALQWLVCRRVGAKRCDARGFAPAEQAAWFISAFVLDHALAFGDGAPIHVAERRVRRAGFVEVAPPDTVRLQAMLRLGRLLEWWRWRAQGLDRAAVSGRKSIEAGRASAASARTRLEPEWREVIASVRRFNATNPIGISISLSAEELRIPVGSARNAWYRYKEKF